MHAKLVLATGRDRGRLLIGSGNLGFQGYASGGELFTHYEYADDGGGDLAAFTGVRAFLERLLQRGYVGAVAMARIHHLFEQTPWLFKTVDEDLRPVRHNLDQNFLDQLRAEVGTAQVEELIAVAPFYDEAAIALEQLLSAFTPAKVRVLVQPGRTSVSPDALDRIRDNFAGTFEVTPFKKGSADPYVHAKVYILKLEDRAVCLQGSPNLSQVAMLRHDPGGNVEIANLLTGGRDEFDALLDPLDVGEPATTAHALDLAFDPADDDVPEPLRGWHLTRGEWSGTQLRLEYSGLAPALDNAILLIGARTFALELVKIEEDTLEIKLDTQSQELLERAVPIAIRWTEGGDEGTSNPVFVCNLAALERTLQAGTGAERLGWIGGLAEVEDEELERLLQELSEAVVIDQEGIWRLAGLDVPDRPTHEGEALDLAYADIDYEVLRQHPKLRQYAGSGAGGGYERSRIQIILNSIAAHFREYTGATPPAPPPLEALSGLEEIGAETEEELEQEAADRERRRSTVEGHLSRVFQSFIRRYLRGVGSAAFQDRAGFEVMTQNYSIFSHILWRLFRKPWMPAEFLVESLATTWLHLFGDAEEAGYLARLSEEDREEATRWLGANHADSLFIASMYYCAYLTRIEDWEEVRFRLRDIWRSVLSRPPFELTRELTSDASRIVASLIAYQPPAEDEIIDELTLLADFDTRKGFLRSLQEVADPVRGIGFEHVAIMRLSPRRQDNVDCLMLRDFGPDGDAGAVGLLAAWMRFERLDYYRIQAEDGGAVCFYDVLAKQGLLWDGRAASEPVTLEEVPQIVVAWDPSLERLRPRGSGQSSIVADAASR